jgi:phosphoribosylaminoimidazole-succinocarboxamide synthase
MLTADRFVRSGKVRDLFEAGPKELLLVASDRMSAFDVVLSTEIPDKGKVLTALSRFWFAETAKVVPNHLVSTETDDPQLRGRMMRCRRAAVLPVELVVRGYLSGSGWKEYRSWGSVCGVALPAGLTESDRLPEPIFTPATKAELGEHDQNIDYASMVRLLAEWSPKDDGRRLGISGAHRLATKARDVALELYRLGAARCADAGIILADTKFEMGLIRNELTLVDEVMTPDSSRFWDAASYQPGGPQASFDKQFVRDWLETQAWDKQAPGPELPAEVVAGTRARYVEAFERITGASFRRYLDEDVIAA